MQEFDRLFLDKDLDQVVKLHYLMDRMKGLFAFRDEALGFLYKVHDREVTTLYLHLI